MHELRISYQKNSWKKKKKRSTTYCLLLAEGKLVALVNSSTAAWAFAVTIISGDEGGACGRIGLHLCYEEDLGPKKERGRRGGRGKNG